ncbi:MAG: 50S ribosomal protein L4 [Thauera sp.]|jgi:large subunit ribosomal protein L4|nr:50S ribosomal protein L4 [Thauera sp.]
MELKLLNDQGQPAATLEASDALFGRDYNEALVHQVVTAYMNNARSANRKQKGRAEVAKSTRKPFRQKGTGNARAGMASSPLWRGGGKIFPNTPDENFSQKINRKMYRAGVASILSQLAREDRIAVVDQFSLEAPKTRLLNQKLKGMGLDSVLVITEEVDENLFLSSRNLHQVLVLTVSEADPVSLIRFPKVIVTKGALAKMEEVWQ